MGFLTKLFNKKEAIEEQEKLDKLWKQRDKEFQDKNEEKKFLIEYIETKGYDASKYRLNELREIKAGLDSGVNVTLYAFSTNSYDANAMRDTTCIRR